MKNYDKVPDIITGKDLDYLNDSFEWNLLALKKTNDSISKIQDEEIKNILQKACRMFDNNLTNIIKIIEGGFNEQSNQES